MWGPVALVSDEWAVLHHVIKSTTFETPTGDPVALIGRMMLATVFISTLLWRILILSLPLVLLESLTLLLMLPLRVLDYLVINVLKLVGPLDSFLE